MADEIIIRNSLQIRKGNVTYQSQPTTFRADVVATIPKGPTPGALTIPRFGKVVDFGELVTPGFVWMMNTEAAGGNYVTYGIWNPTLDVFYPLGEILPGECFTLRLSRNLLEEYSGTGTGTTGPGNKFFMMADTAPVEVRVEAFEK